MRLILYSWPTTTKPEQWPAWRKWVRYIGTHSNDSILSAIWYIRVIIKRCEATAMHARHQRFRDWARSALQAGARAAHRWTKGAAPEFAPILSSLLGVEDEQTQACRRAEAWHSHCNVGKTLEGSVCSHLSELPPIPGTEWGRVSTLSPWRCPASRRFARPPKVSPT